MLGANKQLHAEAAPIAYSQTFEFPGTQVATDFLLRIGTHRHFLTSLRNETYSSQSARTLFHLLTEARNLQRLSFAVLQWGLEEQLDFLRSLRAKMVTERRKTKREE